MKLNKLGVNSFSELEICAKDCGQLKDAKDTQYSFKMKDAKQKHPSTKLYDLAD